MQNNSEQKYKINLNSPAQKIISFIACFIAWCTMAYWFIFLPYSCHTRENLQKEYEEVFATPFSAVQINDYTNSNSGHGLRFLMSVQASSPIQLRNQNAFKEVPSNSRDAERYLTRLLDKHPDWITTCMYTCMHKEQDSSGPIWICFNQSKNMCEVNARVLESQPYKQDPNALTPKIASFIGMLLGAGLWIYLFIRLLAFILGKFKQKI